MSTEGARPLTELGEFILSGWKGASFPEFNTVFGPDKDGYFWSLQRIESGTEDFRPSLTRTWSCPTTEARFVRCDWANDIDGEIVLPAIEPKETA